MTSQGTICGKQIIISSNSNYIRIAKPILKKTTTTLHIFFGVEYFINWDQEENFETNVYYMRQGLLKA